ncbi:MAG TPA: pyrroline-5-carboxylate reductase [archaeon]|nr:pyrroline-5-carboxylate reductase [archaeon]
MAINRRIGIIGAGRMGTALVAGLLKGGVVGKDSLYASDVSDQRCHQLSEIYGIKCFSNNKMVVENSDIVIIAVEPAHMQAVLKDIGEVLSSQLLVSIAAAVSTDFIKQNLKKDVAVVRVMPNNPCLVGEGMIVIASAPDISEKRFKAVEEIFSAVGRVLVLDEDLFDAVTGLSGSGPAFIYLVIEGLVEGGIKSGLSADTALVLAAQTVLGAGKMVLETKAHPSKLREMVTTPGGTTVEGLKELDRSDIKGVFSRAVERAAQKSRELKKT